MPDPGQDDHDTEPTSSQYPDPTKEDIMAGDRRISRPDSSLPDWEMPDAAYRPIPIAWFAGAFLLQMGVLAGIFILLSGQSGWLTIAAAGLATGIIGQWTWDRGMREAPTGWKVATIIVLLVQLAFVCLGAGARI
ncbi:hypothetical protein [Erythrobacter sp. Alg231-14]|uniref:hypothetical protein n=1 Tax=Erythrobacter sp. Alg231-14 TaxID=1922225 RepID=UPI000D54C5A7